MSVSLRQAQTRFMTITRSLTRLAIAAPALMLFAAAMWFAWLGWDHEYYEVDGVAQGPYRTWQVLGCGLAIAVAAVVAQLWARTPWGVLVLAPAAIIGFAVPWTMDAAATDDSGLFVVGLILLVIGGGVGLSFLVGATAAVQYALHPDRRTPRPEGA